MYWAIFNHESEKKNMYIWSKTTSTDHLVCLELKLSVFNLVWFNLVLYWRPMPRIKDWRIYVSGPGLTPYSSLWVSWVYLSSFFRFQKAFLEKSWCPFSCLSPVICVPCLSDLFELLPVREFECSIAKEFIPWHYWNEMTS